MGMYNTRANWSTAPADSTRVQIHIYGGIYEVDSDQVRLLLKKEAAVALAMSLQDDKSPEARETVQKTMGYIIRANRRIRKTVKCIKNSLEMKSQTT